MRRIRVGLGGAIAAAMLVAAMPAGASAAKLLVLSEAGNPVSNGAPATLGLALAGCGIYASGTVTVNGAAKDKVVASAGTPESECPAGVSSSGAITEMQWGANGKVTMKGKISVSKPGPCVYTYSKWKGEFAVPGAASFEATTIGKLYKKTSSKSCPATDTEEFGGAALSP